MVSRAITFGLFLGWIPRRVTFELIVIEYTLPPSMGPRFPTVADAYSSPCWPYFFRPAFEGARHGLTNHALAGVRQ